MANDTLRTTDGSASASGWSVIVPVPAKPTAVRLLGPERERLLVLDPLADSVPTARLDVPARDSVLRVARGEVLLSAEFRDDIGLGEGAFEFIVSAGAGETFTFRSGRVGTPRFEPGVRCPTVHDDVERTAPFATRLQRSPVGRRLEHQDRATRVTQRQQLLREPAPQEISSRKHDR